MSGFEGTLEPYMVISEKFISFTDGMKGLHQNKNKNNYKNTYKAYMLTSFDALSLVKSLRDSCMIYNIG